MPRDVRILLATVVVAAFAQWGRGIPRALAEADIFTIAEVEVRGTRFLAEGDVVEQLALGPETSVWTDKQVLVERLREHPMLRDARITRRVPRGLLVTVAERQPIALAPAPTLEPVDAEGRRLPLDPAVHRLDLPIIASTGAPSAEAPHFPEDVRVLAGELDHLMSADTAFLQRISSIRRRDDGTLVARWTEPPVDFLLPSRASPSRLREGLGALFHAIASTPGAVPDAIDLRFADQVVVRRSRD